jgi:hypothetical protein
MDRLGANMGGREGLVDLGQWMENQGLTQWTPSGIGDEAASMNSMWRGDQRNMLDELAARPGGPPMVDTGAIAADMSGAGREAIGLAPEASKLAGARYIREANNLTDAAPSGEMPFAEALQNRQAYDDAVNYSKLGGSSEDAINEEVSRRAANGLRGGLVESLENTSPELAPRWEQIQENLHNSSAIMGAGQSRGIRELGNQPLSLPSLIGAAGGGIPGMAAAAAVKTGGRAGLANLGRGGSAALDTLGAAGQAVGGQAPLAGGVAARAAAGSMSQELQQSTGEGRGNLLTQAALNSLYSGGQDLGPYSSQFAEAAASKDSNAVANLITRLTMSDPQFRVSVLPALQRMTAEAR